jgi:inhibitor of cysteine peptidase
MIELGAESSGSRQAVQVGDLVVVRLPETPTTGYRWQPTFDETQVRLVDDGYDGEPVPRGAGGERVLTFEVLVPAVCTVRIEKRRSWEDTPAVETYVVELDATG